MTRILVYEWCCSGAARGTTPRAASLSPEGWAMLAAAVADFRLIPGAQIRTILDFESQRRPEVAGILPPIIDRGLNNVAVTWTIDEPVAFQDTAADADFILVIAPEFDRILETRCRWAVEGGATLLGPTPDALALAADKFALAKHLKSKGVLTPKTMVVDREAVPFVDQPRVMKPRFGAGSQETCLLTGAQAFPIVDMLGDMVIQPFIPGQAASVAFLIGPRQKIALAPAAQEISDDGRFRYLGGSAPLHVKLADRAIRIARAAIDTVPGLAGYVGVDVVLGKDGDYVIEINPRLTTSYVGLRALAEDNLMEMLLRVARGEIVAEPRWRSGGVRWSADGNCTTKLAPA